MLQHYYTSCEKGTSGGAGFQCKAKSPGILPEELKVLNNMIGYRIPSSLDPYETVQHPVALRYDYLGADKCILVCSQSNGTDENGRPGNFFAHSVITTPKDFEVCPPIMYWRHAFWRTTDSSNETEIPTTPAFDLAPSLEFEQIWPFLDKMQRHDWFYKLLCAVIYYDQKKRPIVILDDIDNVALWIATVTLALPKVYRPFLTFATYHHDPYQVPFWVTGTTHDSKFRFSPDEYISYFILNAEANRISEGETSVYADFICKNFEAKLYEEKLLTFFDVCNNRLPPRPTRMAEKLAAVTNLYLTIREKSLSPTDSNAQLSLKLFLDEVDKKGVLLPEDLADLISVTEVLANGLSSSPSTQLITSYGQALRLLKLHDQNFNKRLRMDLDFLISFILRGHDALVEQLFPIYDEVYTQTSLAQVVSRPEFITPFTDKAPQDNWRIQYLIWRYLGPLLRFDEPNSAKLMELIHKTLFTVDHLPTDTSTLPSPEADKVLSELIKVTKGEKERFLLDSAVAWKQKSAGRSFNWLYYLIVSDLPLSKRDAYRRYIAKSVPEVDLQALKSYELERDIRATGADNLISQLEAWVKHTEEEPTIQSSVVSKGLELTWDMASPKQKQLITEQILTSEILSPKIDSIWMSTLVGTYFGNLKLEKITNSQTMKLYQQFLERPGLEIEQQALMGGSLALTKGVFHQKTVDSLQKWLSKLDKNVYRQEAEKLIVRFFAKEILADAHADMIKATYVYHDEEIFWELYWSGFTSLLFDVSRIKQFMELLAFWFDDGVVSFEEHRYAAPSFFLQLPAVLEAAQASKVFKRVAKQIDNEAATRSWYPLVSHYFTEQKKKGLVELLLRR